MASKLGPVCYVSDEHRFVWVLIPKNASSTIRRELQDRCGARQESYRDLSTTAKQSYFTFVFLRDPVDRVLSAYQEISLRAEVDPEDYAEMGFVSMPEGPERFETFLDEVARTGRDNHARPQVRFIEGIRVDDYGCVEDLEVDLNRIMTRFGIDDISQLPQRRSRLDRERAGHIDRVIRRHDLTPTLLSQIHEIYRHDEALYRKVALGST